MNKTRMSHYSWSMSGCAFVGWK